MSSFLDSLVREILGLPAWSVYLVVGGIVFLEDAVFVGFVLPGETVAILGGVAASLGHVSFPVVLAIVILAAIAGDSVGYEVGKHFGPRVLALRPLQRHGKRLKDAQDKLANRGGVAVFLGRWVAFLRAVMPALAGMSGMRYPTFLMWNAAGGIAWGATVVSLGYAAGTSYGQVEKWLGRGAAVTVAAIVVVGVIVWSVRRRRREARQEAAPSPPEGREPVDRVTPDHDANGG